MRSALHTYPQKTIINLRHNHRQVGVCYRNEYYWTDEVVCANREDADQPVHPCSLIRDFPLHNDSL